jgi:hypothetical protein
MRYRQSTTMREVDPLSFIFINFYISALTPDLHCPETMMEFSNNKTLLAICRIQTGVVCKRGLDEHHMFWGIIYIHIE